MLAYHALDELRLPNAWLTVGSFDGVHRGHQAILHKLTAGAHAAGVPAVVLTFEPHPLAVLRPERVPLILTPLEEKARLLEALGVDYVIAHPFDRQVAGRTAGEFLAAVKGQVGFTRFWVGYDFAMGRNREGDQHVLRALGAEMGYTLEVVTPAVLEGEVVSSSQVRALLAAGQVEKAAGMLGRPYRLTGPVVAGARRGRSLGIPTANVAVPAGRAVPLSGVYACRVHVNGKIWGAAANVGVRPTFEAENGPVSVEAHLLDFDQEIYGETVHLDFLARLRGEQKFPHAEALLAQVQADIAQARATLREAAGESVP